MADRVRKEASPRFDPQHSAGLFIGVSEFQDAGINRLAVAVDDAIDLAHLFALEVGLLDPARVTLLLSGEAKKEESRKGLEELQARGARIGRPTLRGVLAAVEQLAKETRPNGICLLSVASHGLAIEGTINILTEDSYRPRPDRLAIRLPEVIDEVTRGAAGRALLLVDTCRERWERGPENRALESTEAFAEALAQAQGVAVLTGTIHGGYSYEHHARDNGVFTAAVLDGLRGAAPPSAQGWVTIGTLASYVEEQVVAWIRDQKPAYAEKSLGIEKRTNAASEAIPLAPHPQAAQDLAEYIARREAALEHLKRFQGKGKPLTGADWDCAESLLPLSKPNERELELLQEIEEFDGTPRLVRSLRQLLNDLGGGAAPAALDPPASPQAPSVVVSSPEPIDWKGKGEPPAGFAIEGPIGMRLHWIPRGTYTLGSPKDEPGRVADREKEPYEVTLPQGFWMAETPITQAQWHEVFPEATPWYFKNAGRDAPVESVTWYEAIAFANRLSEREGLAPRYLLSGAKGTIGKDLSFENVGFLEGDGYRLPSEDEWEIAARAGTTTAL